MHSESTQTQTQGGLSASLIQAIHKHRHNMKLPTAIPPSSLLHPGIEPKNSRSSHTMHYAGSDNTPNILKGEGLSYFHNFAHLQSPTRRARNRSCTLQLCDRTRTWACGSACSHSSWGRVSTGLSVAPECHLCYPLSKRTPCDCVQRRSLSCCLQLGGWLKGGREEC